MLKFYFRLRFLRLHYHRHVILHLATKIRPNRTIRDRVMTSYPFFKMATVCHIEFFRGNCRDHLRNANEGVRSILKFRLDRFYSFGDIAIFML